jgi:hypothetical protein
VRVLGHAFAAALVVLGVVFVVAAAASGLWPRYVVGGVLIGAGVAVIAIVRMKRPASKVEVTQKIEVSGDVRLEELRCSRCGAGLDSRSVTVRAGAAFVSCPYCKAEYQIEEAPRW